MYVYVGTSQGGSCALAIGKEIRVIAIVNVNSKEIAIVALFSAIFHSPLIYVSFFCIFSLITFEGKPPRKVS
jgi:hypothetical protein